MPAQIALSRWNRGGTVSYSDRMHPVFTLRGGSPSISLPKATALRQVSPAVCENRLISSYRLAERLKQCYTQNSERLNMTDAGRRTTRVEKGRCLEGTDARWFPFRDVTTSCRVRSCLLYTSPSPRDVPRSRMPSSA